jgi:MSHA biogenesis protein MshN
VSVINKMLQDLDRRSAVAASGLQSAPQPVKPAHAARGAHEWFWRVVAALVLISLGWVGWVAYQLQPRHIATPLAMQLAQQPQPVAAGVQSKRPTEPSAEVPKPPLEAVAPELKAAPVAVPAKLSETFKLARSIETPIPAAKPQAEIKALPKLPQAAAKPPTKPRPAAAEKSTPSENIVVDRRDRSKAASERADAHFRRAAALLNQGRVSEAEHDLGAALHADTAHVPARQAYVALLLEQQRVDVALRLLREAVELHPSQAAFALALARVYAEQRDYPAALAVLEKAGDAAERGDFQALRAAILQRQGRHAEAVNAYHSALKSAEQPGTWTGLGISLEATGRQAEAAQAYQRALGMGALPPELKDYAEARVRALR